MNSLLFIGHPGHELMVYQFLKDYRPDVAFLTTGSGSINEPRMKESVRLVESLGLTVRLPFEPLSDRQIYDLILSKDLAFFKGIKKSLKQLIVDQGYDLLAGDAQEGFNPSHDICRYLINGIVEEINPSRKILNLDFLLDQLVLIENQPVQDGEIRLELNERERIEKIAACRVYTPIKSEVDRFIAKYGEGFFGTELLRPVLNTSILKSWEESAPHYETHGKNRVSEGIYKSTILYDQHVKQIAEMLTGSSAQ